MFNFFILVMNLWVHSFNFDCLAITNFIKKLYLNNYTQFSIGTIDFTEILHQKKKIHCTTRTIFKPIINWQ